MSALAISLVAFACIFGSTLLGMFIRTILPGHHVSDESKDVVKLGTGIIATMAALVLALMIASAKGNFDTMNSGLRQIGSRVILLDRIMAHYGPETMEARDLLRRSVTSAIARIWPEDKIRQAVAKAPKARVDIETIQDKLRQLSPQNDAQRWLQSRALQISGEIAEGALAPHRADRAKFDPDAIPRDAGLLAHHPLRQLWPVLPQQRNGNCRLAHLRLVGRWLNLSDPGVGHPLRRADKALKCPAAQRPGAYLGG